MTSDRLLTGLDNALRTVFAPARAGRPCPVHPTGHPPPALDAAERRLSGALMRVNQVGEVCAQALYQAQALTAGSVVLRQQMQQAAREETDHLAWTQVRLAQLGARPSLLNPLWYGGAFAFGLIAGRLGDATSLGFVVETEAQVEEHLAGHLDRLPTNDLESRAIVAQMKADEAEHGQRALAAGASEISAPARWLMRCAARVMTTVAHRI